MSTALATTSPSQFSWWDRLLITISPQWGFKRARAKAAALASVRSFEAASSSRRTAGWHSPSTDANAATAPSIAKLRELARDLRRNNGWAKRGIQVISGNVVGYGISAQAKAKDPALATAAQQIWNEWAESIACDYDGRMPFVGLQRLVMDAIVESGECLILREAANSSDGLPVPLRIRVLEGDYIDSTKRREGDGNKIVQGIELDGSGRRVAYWIYEEHPGASGIYSTKSRRVKASDAIHLYQVERPSQLRGVSWLAAAIAKLADFDDYDDAKLMQAKIAACFGAFVTDPQGDPGPLGAEDDDDEQLESLEPGQIQYLPPGREIAFPSPPSTSDHGGFTETQLRRIAASLGVTYEDLTMDYSKVNFSSARMARQSHWQNVHMWRWTLLIPLLCDGVWSWVMELAKGLEDWPSAPRAQWSAPPMPTLSPEKEGLAYQRLVRAGAMTQQQVVRERGEDFDSFLAEYAESNRKLDALGIVLDSDARKVSAAGLVQPTASPDTSEDEG